MSRCRSLVVGLGLILTAALFGCGGATQSVKPPTLHKAEGIVLGKDGKPYPGGMINFKHKTNTEFSSNAKIEPDGKFQLVTIAGSQSYPGAQEGEHIVMILPPADSQDAAKPHILTKPYSIQPGDNQLTIKLE